MRVLVVEDNFLAAEAISLLIEDLGHQVVGPVATVKDALFALHRQVVDVAMLDVDLRGEPVTPVAVRLRELGCPLIFLTAYSSLDYLPPACQDAPILGKPLHVEDLRKALSSARAEVAAS